MSLQVSNCGSNDLRMAINFIFQSLFTYTSQTQPFLKKVALLHMALLLFFVDFFILDSICNIINNHTIDTSHCIIYSFIKILSKLMEKQTSTNIQIL